MDWQADFGAVGKDANGDDAVVHETLDAAREVESPKVSAKQAQKFAESMLRGEPNREKIIATIAEDRIREI